MNAQRFEMGYNPSEVMQVVVNNSDIATLSLSASSILCRDGQLI